MDNRRIRAVALAAALVGYSATAGLAIPGRRQPVVQAALGTSLAVWSGARLGLRGAALRSGLRLGLVAASAVAVGVVVSTSVPAVGAAMTARELPEEVWKWLLVDIPLGTVWGEEAAYRGALGTLAADALGPVAGQLLQAGAFGLSHIVDARGTGEPVLGTVLVTGLAGWLFGWLAQRSGGLLAPALAHLAINEAGALAALATQRRARRLAQPGRPPGPPLEFSLGRLSG